MKTIDFDSKMKSIKELLAEKVPVVKVPPKKVINKARLTAVIKIISNELLKDPVLVSLMALRSDPTEASAAAFLSTVRDKIDHATGRRYKELLDEIFVEEKKNDQRV